MMVRLADLQEKHTDGESVESDISWRLTTGEALFSIGAEESGARLLADGIKMTREAISSNKFEPDAELYNNAANAISILLRYQPDGWTVDEGRDYVRGASMTVAASNVALRSIISDTQGCIDLVAGEKGRDRQQIESAIQSFARAMELATEAGRPEFHQTQGKHLEDARASFDRIKPPRPRRPARKPR